MTNLLEPQTLAWLGIAFVGAFALWKTQLAPRLAARRVAPNV
jgi:hypothetical protein